MNWILDNDVEGWEKLGGGVSKLEMYQGCINLPRWSGARHVQRWA